MSNVNDLNEVISRPTYRSDYAQAKAQRTCIRCGHPATRFRDFSAKFEYTVSALCQQCQDQFLSSRQKGEKEAQSGFLKGVFDAFPIGWHVHGFFPSWKAAEPSVT